MGRPNGIASKLANGVEIFVPDWLNSELNVIRIIDIMENNYGYTIFINGL